MTTHTLTNRSDTEVLWFQRRHFLLAAAAWSGLGGAGAVLAQGRSNVVEQQGDILVNGQTLLLGQSIQSGDTILSGPGAYVIFVIGNASFHVRQNTTLTLERGASLDVVSLLRLFAGAVVSVWGPGLRRRIVTPTLTAGIRGTGVYTEVWPDQRSYLCNCYGTVDVAVGAEQTVSQSDYHQSFWGEVTPKDGRYLTPAKAINHTDEELEYLARLVGQRTNWQVLGRKGVKNGMGYMQDSPGQQHPASQAYGASGS